MCYAHGLDLNRKEFPKQISVAPMTSWRSFFKIGFPDMHCIIVYVFNHLAHLLVSYFFSCLPSSFLIIDHQRSHPFELYLIAIRLVLFSDSILDAIKHCSNVPLVCLSKPSVTVAFNWRASGWLIWEQFIGKYWTTRKMQLFLFLHRIKDNSNVCLEVE